MYYLNAWLIAFTNGQRSGVPRDAVVTAFGEHVRWERNSEGWTRYSGTDDGCRIRLHLLDSDPSLTSFVSLGGFVPVKDRRLWDSLHRIMRLGNVAVIYAGKRGPLIAAPSVADHVPPKLLGWGQAVVVNGGDEIAERITSA